MGSDHFRIRIRKDGTVHFVSRELDPERQRLLTEWIEDRLGRIAEIRQADGDDLPPAQVDAAAAEHSRKTRKK